MSFKSLTTLLINRKQLHVSFDQLRPLKEESHFSKIIVKEQIKRETNL